MLRIILASGFKAFEQSFTQVPTLVGSAHGVVLEVGPGGERKWNVFDAAPENEAHRIEQQNQQQHAGNDPVRDYFL